MQKAIKLPARRKANYYGPESLLQIWAMEDMSKRRPKWYATACSRANEIKASWQHGKKLKLMGKKAGFPDIDFTPVKGQRVFVEFKAKGKKAEPHQLAIHADLREAGHEVYLIDNKEDWLALMDRWPYS